MMEYSLIDIWRTRHPTEQKFTRTERSRAGLVQSRLDYWLISESITYLIRDSSIKPGKRSDHSLIKILIELIGTQERGPSYWKFNNALLFERDYVDTIKNEIVAIKKNCNLSNKNTFWDYAKCQIRTCTISFSALRSRQRQEKEKFLLRKLEQLENDMIHSSEKTNNYFECKSEWENLERIKTEGAILRSKVKWAEEGEKNTKYFLNLEKKNYQVKYIKKLIKDNGTELTNPRDILQEQKQFYSSLYSSKLDSFKYSSDNFFAYRKDPYVK